MDESLRTLHGRRFCFAKLAAVRPESQTGVGDEEDFLAVQVVDTVAKPGGVIFCEHRRQISEGEANAFDFFPGKVSGA